MPCGGSAGFRPHDQAERTTKLAAISIKRLCTIGPLCQKRRSRARRTGSFRFTMTVDQLVTRARPGRRRRRAHPRQGPRRRRRADRRGGAADDRRGPAGRGPGGLREPGDHRARLTVRDCLRDGALGPPRRRDREGRRAVPADRNDRPVGADRPRRRRLGLPQQHADRRSFRAGSSRRRQVARTLAQALSHPACPTPPCSAAAAP